MPSCASAPVIIMIGFLLFDNTSQINWRDVREALPVYMCTVICAFSYSVLYGLFFGIVVHIAINLLTSSFDDIIVKPIKYIRKCLKWIMFCDEDFTEEDETIHPDSIALSQLVNTDLNHEELLCVQTAAESYSSFEKSAIKTICSDEDISSSIQKSILANTSSLKYSKHYSFSQSTSQPELSLQLPRSPKI